MRFLGLSSIGMLLLAACTGQVPRVESTNGIELESVPFFPQTVYQCGPAALATSLAASDVPVSAADLVAHVYIPDRRGSLQPEMLAAARSHDRLPYQLRGAADGLIAELTAGRPVLVLQNLGVSFLPRWHYAVVVGVDQSRDRWILRSGKTARKVMTDKRFMDSWRRAEHWAVVLLKPGELPATVTAERYLETTTAFERVAATSSAISAYRAAVERWPEYPTASFGLANAIYRSGDLAEAERAYRDLIRDYPNYAAARNNLAQILLDRGCPMSAASEIDRALQINGYPQLKPLLEQTAVQIRKYSEQDQRDCPSGERQ